MNQTKLNIAEREIEVLKLAINDVLQEALLFKERLKENKFISRKHFETLSTLNKKENNISNIVTLIKTSTEDNMKDDLDIIDIPKSPFEDEENNKEELRDVLLTGIDERNNDKEFIIKDYEKERKDYDNVKEYKEEAILENIVPEKEILLEMNLYLLNGSVNTVKITTIDELEDKKAKKKALHKAAKSYNKQSGIQKPVNKSSKAKQKVKNNDRKTGFIEKLIAWFKSKF